MADVGFMLNVERAPFTTQMLADATLDWTMFDGVVLQLLFGNQQSARITGSAVMVAPGLAIAARHVIDPELPRLRSNDPSDPQGLLALGIASGGGIHIWRAHQVCQRPNHDVALLILDRASDFSNGPTIKQAIMSTRMPAVGEVIGVSGFVAENINFSLQDGCKGRIHTSQGIGARTISARPRSLHFARSMLFNSSWNAGRPERWAGLRWNRKGCRDSFDEHW